MADEKKQEINRSKSSRRTFATVDLSESQVATIAETCMDRRHNELNALLDTSDTETD